MKKLAKYVVRRLMRRLPKTRLGDQIYHALLFMVAHRRLPRRNSGLFNDYLFFLKTGIGFDSVHRQFVSDKDLVKIYYRGVIGADLAPRTLAKFYTFEDLLAARIPAPCVIKPAHLSGCVYFGGLPRRIDSSHHAEISSWFNTNIYLDISRERNYRLLAPSVICEELIASQETVRDYKIFCFMGEPKAVQVDVGRHGVHKRRMYTVEWKPLPYAYNKPLASVEEAPELLSEALELARKLAAAFEFIRVDVYFTGDRVWLGEMTSVPENAHGRFESSAAEASFSKLVFEGLT